ncbi:penicillin-binding protein [Sodalis-like endosymbiont of Proechinophthirus fluctus]|uniref:penicillin-binding protein activator LpoB n=1 Tax=Sodalis-like endosymbiont of Proechinophthirus fluctus TaxID=1462730 RepID=UPI0007A7F090|nr:penicillin-binding protein activator LpoB [Sodalis-like endosymbiont of Proechinophthirus fluctus]KYP97494.1 penicillin-binding protein [Sodalis-like endosymbiont of Proechinophthirus fluctus]
MKKTALILLTALMLASCTTRNPSPLLATIEPVPLPATVPVQPPVTSVPVPMPQKIKTIDWHASLSPMVQQMLAVEEINDSSVLLVNTLNNATNGSMQTGKATAVLTRLIVDGGGKFQVVGADKLNAARQMLGLSADDSLESRSKAVGLARYLNAQYVLYSTASGYVKAPTLDLQLMLVQTGEIIWSSNGIAQD